MKLLQIRVKPNAKKQAIQTAEDGSLIISLKSPPVDGKANEELIELLAQQFKVSKSRVFIKSGRSSKHKLVEIDLNLSRLENGRFPKLDPAFRPDPSGRLSG
jgi:uncharacterized protein (TIGR00251 family)